MQKRFFINIAPVLAAVVLWTLLFQSIHRFEHYADSKTEHHHACCDLHHPPAPYNSDNRLVLDETNASNCVLCEYEFAFFANASFINSTNICVLPHSKILPVVSAFHSVYSGLHEQLRAPPF